MVTAVEVVVVLVIVGLGLIEPVTKVTPNVSR